MKKLIQTLAIFIGTGVLWAQTVGMDSELLPHSGTGQGETTLEYGVQNCVEDGSATQVPFFNNCEFVLRKETAPQTYEEYLKVDPSGNLDLSGNDIEEINRVVMQDAVFTGGNTFKMELGATLGGETQHLKLSHFDGTSTLVNESIMRSSNVETPLLLTNSIEVNGPQTVSSYPVFFNARSAIQMPTGTGYFAFQDDTRDAPYMVIAGLTTATNNPEIRLQRVDVAVPANSTIGAVGFDGNSVYIDPPGIAGKIAFKKTDVPTQDAPEIRLESTGAGSPAIAMVNNGESGSFYFGPDKFVASRGVTVQGVLEAEEVKTSKWQIATPDYVFAPDYELKPLSDVEKYVKENNHLPEIPSAKEFEEKGLDLATMSMLLLKKVEELTLYSIEQDKLIATQKRKIDKQQTQLNVVQNQIKILIQKY